MHTFSSSNCFLTLALSSLAIRASSSSSRENFLFSPRPGILGCWSSTARLSFGGVLFGFTAPRRRPEGSKPAWVRSKSRTARSRASRSCLPFSSCSSRSSCSLAFANRLISFFWARMLLKAHSRQKISPWVQDTGSRAGSRQSRQEPNGRKESRESRAEEEAHEALAICRSYEVKIGRLVFLLPSKKSDVVGCFWMREGRKWTNTYCATFCLDPVSPRQLFVEFLL